MKMNDSNKAEILTLESFYLVENSSEKNNLRNRPFVNIDQYVNIEVRYQAQYWKNKALLIYGNK